MSNAVGAAGQTERNYREPEKKCLAQDGRIKINHYAWAYYKPGQIIGGVKVYGTEYTSSYA